MVINIPRRITKNKHTYEFVDKCNNGLFRYREINCGYTECFSLFDLNLVEKTKKVKEARIHGGW